MPRHALLLDLLDPQSEFTEPAKRDADRRAGDVMYIEWKSGLAGHARIGRVQESGSGKTLYYRGYALTSLKGTHVIDICSGTTA